MDLVLMILRFLFGIPAETRQVEPILVHSDGSTSNGRRWLATQRGIEETTGESPHRWRFLHSMPDSSGGLWERICFWRSETRFVSRRQEERRAVRN